MLKRLFPLILLILLVVFGFGDCLAGQLRDGDIVFQTSGSSQSIAIQKATGSKYSHLGVIFFRNGNPYVYEAIKTVQSTPLRQWIARGLDGDYVVKRLRDADQVLTPTGLAKLRQAAGRFQGKPYDLTFEWSDNRVYCSELVWKIYDRGLGLRIGRLQKLRDFDLTDPVVKQEMKERYGNKVPLNETVISPGEMFSSPDLRTVVEE